MAAHGARAISLPPGKGQPSVDWCNYKQQHEVEEEEGEGNETQTDSLRISSSSISITPNLERLEKERGRERLDTMLFLVERPINLAT